jgi:NADH dehydrogenase
VTPQVVIVGGGFAGLYLARDLGRLPVRVTVVDRTNHHLFQPMLYQVATAALAAGDISSPIRSVLRRQLNTEVLLAEAVEVDLVRREVGLADGDRLPFDYVVLAPGARHSYFSHPEWEALAPGLKNLEDAGEIRRRILLAFERAEREPDPVVRQRHLTFVVVGGGPTGVEVAGAIAEVARFALRRDFRRIDPRDASILLLEGGPRVLPA